MEGFLQSLKYRSPARQRKVCALVGKEAKKAGKYKFWWKITGKLRWQGRAIKRKSDEYGELLIRAYSALYLNLDFRAALEATQGYKLTHTSGKHERGRTVLTEEEFISLLERLRGSTETRKLSGKA